MSDKIGIGLIGCGGISAVHRDGWLAASDIARMVATCDVNRQSAELRKEELNAETAYEDYRLLLKRDDLTAVDLCLPHDLHAEVAIAAAQAGKHILCEKPIAVNQEEARRMIHAAEQNAVTLMIAYCERYSNAHVAMKRLVEAGEIGKPFLLRIDHSQWVDYPAGHWINDPTKLGGGVVAGSGPHRLDMLRWFGGEVRRVAARAVNTGLTQLGGEDTAVIALEFDSGAIGEMTCTWSARRYPWYEGFLVFGRGGMVHNIGGVQLSRNGGDFTPVPLPHDDAAGFREEIAHFLSCIQTGATPLTSGQEALKTLQLVEAVYTAIKSSNWVDVAAFKR
ncbi:MAG: Gfo/Idh/MocA family oxidoreductase [Armatimonadetes bacterium]|nr:Gfo/Idh/MocA family oxidoreductase [Armatimonadota bacterium]